MFKFRLQTVLDFRKRIEEGFQKGLAEKNKILINETETLKNFENDFLAHESSLNDEKKRKIINVDYVKSYYSYFDWLANQIEMQKKKVSAAKENFLNKRQELMAATRNKKMLEILAEKDYLKYVEDIKHKEQIVIDEIVTTQYGRKILTNF